MPSRLDTVVLPEFVIALDPAAFRAGFNAVRVATRAPRRVTLKLWFADPTRVPVAIPLSRIGGNGYGRAMKIASPVARATLVVCPAWSADDVSGLEISRLSLWSAARHAARAVGRHAKRPKVLAAKLWQATGRSSLRFTTPVARDLGDAYLRWLEAFEHPEMIARVETWCREAMAHRRLRLAIVRGNDTNRSWLGPVAGTDVVAIPEPRKGASLAEALQLQRVDGFILASSHGCLAPHAGLAIAAALTTGDIDAVTFDDDQIGPDGRRFAPRFKPSWSPALQLGSDYIGEAVAFAANERVLSLLATVETSSRAREAILDGLASIGMAARVRHLPAVLMHEQSPPVAATRARPCATIPPARRVTAIIPTKNNPEQLRRAVESVLAARDVVADVIVIDNGAASAKQAAMLNHLTTLETVRVVRDADGFNFSRLINRGRAAATGDTLVLLNDDVESIDDGWLAALTARALEPDVGCVGALLLYPNGRVQHAGVALGLAGVAGHMFRHLDPSADPRLKSDREVSAVTGACLAVGTRDFDAVGGFAEDLPVTLNDVDFCLKVAALGRRNLVTPAARLIHHESVSRGLDSSPTKLARLEAETAIFLSRWGDAVLRDPYLSPHLDPDREDLVPLAI